jgi:hypothetical protein
MENTHSAAARTLDPQVWWLLVHGATVALWRDAEEQGGPPRDDQAQTAYEALGILHAQAHTYLENASTYKLMESCPIDPWNVAPAQLLLAPEGEPDS